MSKSDAVDHLWRSYVESLPDKHPHTYLTSPDAWSFGDDTSMADELGALVLKGIKTATCCRYLGGNVLDEAGPSILLDGTGELMCVLETYEIVVKRFRDVDATFAADEGEGDRSLRHWRAVHWDFFTREGAREGYEVSEDMLLQCERFRVLYRTGRCDRVSARECGTGTGWEA